MLSWKARPAPSDLSSPSALHPDVGGLEFRVQGLELRVKGLRIRVQGCLFRV